MERLDALISREMALYVRRELEAGGLRGPFNSTWAGRRKNLSTLAKLAAKGRDHHRTNSSTDRFAFALALAERLPGLWDEVSSAGSLPVSLAVEIAELASLTTNASTYASRLREVIQRSEQKLKLAQRAEIEATRKLAEHSKNSRANASKGGMALRWYVVCQRRLFQEVAARIAERPRRVTQRAIRDELWEFYSKDQTIRTIDPIWRKLPRTDFSFCVDRVGRVGRTSNTAGKLKVNQRGKTATLDTIQSLKKYVPFVKEEIAQIVRRKRLPTPNAFPIRGG